ncbi:hypothetical protein RKD47_001622 [Streptomyces albogriseolus]
MPGEQRVVRRLVRGEQVAQSAALGDHVRLTGVPQHPGEQQDRAGAGDACPGRGEFGPPAGDGRHGHPGVREVAAGVAGPQAEQDALRGEDGAVSDAQVVGRVRQPVVQGEAQGEVAAGDVLDDHVVGAGDEDTAGAAAVAGGGLAGGEVQLAAVAGQAGGLVAQADPEGGVEGPDPLERASVGEVLGGGEVAGEQPVLDVGERVGQQGRQPVPAARVVVRADEGVVGDDGPVVVRVAEDEGAVPAVAAQEGVLPAGGRPGLPGAVHGSGGHGASTATP